MQETLGQVGAIKLRTTSNVLLAMQRIQGIHTDLEQIAHLLLEELTLTTDKISPQELLRGGAALYKKEGNDVSAAIVLKAQTKHRELTCDTVQMMALISRSLSHAETHNRGNKPLTIKLKDAILDYSVEGGSVEQIAGVRILITTFSDPVYGEDELYIGGHPRDDGEVARSLKMEGLSVLSNLQVIDAHYGYVGFQVVTARDYQQFYVIPAQLREAQQLHKRYGSKR